MKCVHVFLALSLVLCLSFSYKLRCPDASQWAMRARLLCQDPSKYSCVLDGNAELFIEKCTRVDLERQGRKTIIHGGYDSEFCSIDRYQPFIYWTNVSSDCIYTKSPCNEEGQVIYDDSDPDQDTKCICEYTRGYDFVTRPSNPCYCVPSKEDCSCYLKPCKMSNTQAGYRCTETANFTLQNDCLPFKNNMNNSKEDTRTYDGQKELKTKLSSRRDNLNILATLVLICMIVMIGFCGIILWCRVQIDFVLNHLVRKVYVIRPLSSESCYEGEECNLICEISKPSPICWYKDKSILVAGNNVLEYSRGCVHTLFICNMSKENDGTYELRSLFGKTLSTASVQYRPVFVAGVDSQTCFEGDPVSFSCEVSEDYMQVKWLKGDEINYKDAVLTGRIESTGMTHRLQFLNPKPSDTGFYWIKSKNARRKAKLTVKVLIKTHLAKTVILEGLDVNLTCEAEKTGIEAKWYKDGKEITASDNITINESDGVYKLTIRNVSLQNKGQYKIIIDRRSSEAFLDVKEIPKVLKEMSQHDRDAFMKAAKAGTAPRYYIRIMIVGESGVGKTCLLRRLLNEEIDDVTSTDGINIEVRKCKIDVAAEEWIFTRDDRKTLTPWTENSDRYADCGFWDFAGQKEYYATHQTFLTANAVYILTVDLSKDWGVDTISQRQMVKGEFQNIGEYIDFWLSNIHCYASDVEKKSDESPDHLSPPVLLVGTGKDKIQGSWKENKNIFEHYLDVLLKNKMQRHHLQNRFYISNKYPSNEKQEFAGIRDAIFNLAKRMPKWGQLLPLRWILLEKQILDSTENVISYDEVFTFAIECSLPVQENRSELDAFLRYEHEIGNIIFFDNVKTYIILDPKWLVDAFRCLIAPEQFNNMLLNLAELKQTGKISDDLIEKLFKKVPDLCFHEHKPYLLSVMSKFDILVQSPFEENLANEYYMPCMIKGTEFDDIRSRFGVQERKCEKSSWFCVDFEFLPLSFFNHVLVAYIRKYPLAMESGNKPALYRGIGIFDLTENKCRKLAVCVSSCTIAIQIWQWDSMNKGTIHNDYLRKELMEIVMVLQQRYRISINFTQKLKCPQGNYFLSDGKIEFSENDNYPSSYYCSEHKEAHQSYNEIPNKARKNISVKIRDGKISEIHYSSTRYRYLHVCITLL